MITVEQILYTSAPQRWWALAEELGFAAVGTPSAEWSEFRADGLLALHRVTESHPAGSVDLHVIVDDVDRVAAALCEHNVARTFMAGVGDVLTVHASSGVVLTVAAGAGEPHLGKIAVQPIWFQPDVDEATAILTAVGLRAEIAANDGGWVEFRADRGGSIGVHMSEAAGVGASFLSCGDLAERARVLTDAGFPAHVIDEAYGRSMRITNPDGGSDIWINGAQEDLYGYHRPA